MKPRNSEAARLEADYMARLNAALTDRDPADAAEIAQSIAEHIEEATAEHNTAEVTLVQMANILERLGSPESYAAGDTPAGLGQPAAMTGPLTTARHFDKRRAAGWSFVSLLAVPALGVGSVGTDGGTGCMPAVSLVLFIGMVLAAIVSVVMGRLALHQRALPGDRLPGGLRFLAALGPMCLSGLVFFLLFLLLPWHSFYPFEWAGMGQEGKLFGQPFAGEDHNLPLFGAGIVYAVTSLILALLVRYQTKWLKLVFYPVFERLKPAHWKWLLIPIAIGLTVAGIKLGQFLRASA